MYLLGTVVRKEGFGMLNTPTKEEQHGICALTQRVGQGLSDAFKSATSGSPPENALRGDSRRGGDFSGGKGGNRVEGGLQGDARGSRGRESADIPADSQNP